MEKITIVTLEKLFKEGTNWGNIAVITVNVKPTAFAKSRFSKVSRIAMNYYAIPVMLTGSNP
ncbi:hypothetical protein HP567_013280 [Brevibacillus sp. M2.1A]|uniref:hypothetical protein n=1 Tax=Brevibacillus TaxID=55080 RepID=UPI00156BCA2D|nr:MULTISPECIES: hypothetical protein [Brevibacillus]MBY0088218.1 hypothetical protein [Brevibacillus brevis]MCC8435518.1 hypothetical protein [Brevibacillus sp. M2.1A]MCE0452043.1 hypothetical protein [Brevibacillus sp. AF8]MCM3141624.1 hypothetical protein [Brevibacillus sp. MER 51]